ncbi:hypothetical protein CCACVL1_13010 [Corchorus capsularis]|uniref:No apical meristem (NAM) protein n=1 Tax=Corchorus capsularis TaxID=210143 RepID=A0A1R3ICR4_COCAP|nr:hypothetical protein CCACVL1_13010 [Corchorus capsularis]
MHPSLGRISSRLDEWVLCRIYKKNSSAQKPLASSTVSSKEHSNNGSSSSSSSQLDDMLESLPEIDDRFFTLPRMNSLKTLQNDEKMGFQNLGSGNFDWASLAGLSSVPEMMPVGQTQAQSQAIPSYGNNDAYVPTMPPNLCQMDTSTNKIGNSVEEEVQSGIRNNHSGFLQQNSSVLTQNFSSSMDPYGFRYPTQSSGFGFRH